MTIKAIFFDMGGVILRTADKTERTKLAKEFGMSMEELDRFVFECKTAAQASMGMISVMEHWLDVTRRLKLPDQEMPRIRDAFFGGDIIDQEIISLLRSLKSTHKTGLISNAWDDMREWMTSQKIEDAFNILIISAEVGFAKPDPRIYQLALEKAGVSAEESIFVDDVEKNITACNALGMHGVHFKNQPQAMQEIRALLQI